MAVSDPAVGAVFWAGTLSPPLLGFLKLAGASF